LKILVNRILGQCLLAGDDLVEEEQKKEVKVQSYSADRTHPVCLELAAAYELAPEERKEKKKKPTNSQVPAPFISTNRNYCAVCELEETFRKRLVLKHRPGKIA